jgi:hypothetical protein
LERVRTEVHGVLRRTTAPTPFFSPDGTHAILLVGSHTWNNFQDIGFTTPPPVFDYEGFLDSLTAWNHNFFRLYVWEQAKFAAGTPRPYWVAPLPYLRTGPGIALDDLPKFDLRKWNEAYFTRLHERVAAARRRGIYVSVMLFNGWSLEGKGGKQHGNPWPGHPLNGANNINGIDADHDHDGEGKEAHTLRDPAVLAIQERYVRKVVATVQDLDNVLFEISNESAPGSAPWQYHMIRLIHDAERNLPYQHPVGMTVEWPSGDNALLTASPADWFSPNGDLEQPQPFPGGKVVIWDTDHLCGMCASIGWVWKGFLSGYNPILMDGWDGKATDIGFAPYEREDPKWGYARRNLGYALTIANRFDLTRLAPHPELASTGYCLADTTVARATFLVYVRRGGRVRHATVDVDLRGIPEADTLHVEWLNLRNGTIRPGRPVAGGRRVHFTQSVRAETLLILERR